MSENTGLPYLNSNGYWKINTIAELIALAKNPNINISNFITDLNNFLFVCRSDEFLSPTFIEWKDDGLQTINLNFQVHSDSDPNDIIDLFQVQLEPVDSDSKSDPGKNPID